MRWLPLGHTAVGSHGRVTQHDHDPTRTKAGAITPAFFCAELVFCGSLRGFRYGNGLGCSSLLKKQPDGTLQITTRMESGRFYHIYNRGNNRETLFKEQRNYSYFLKRYRYYLCPLVDTFAYCLLPNHFHLLIRVRRETPGKKTLQVLSPGTLRSSICGMYHNSVSRLSETVETCKVSRSTAVAAKQPVPETTDVSGPTAVSRAFSNLFNSYTKSINKAYGRTGKLFQERFRRKPVDSERYLLTLMRYIHRNPQKHWLVADYRHYPHSSYHELLSNRKTWLVRLDI